MKKLLATMILFLGVVVAVSAQSFLINTAIHEMEQGNHDVAKQSIDEVFGDLQDKYKTKALKVRGDVYYYIAVDTNYTHLDKDASFVSLDSYIQCIEAEKDDKKKKYTEEAMKAMPESAVAVYLKALNYYDKKDYETTLKYWDLLIKGYETDTLKGILKRLNSAKNDVIQNCATVALSLKDNDRAKKYLNRLIEDPKYLSPNGYLQLSIMELEKGDTAKALEIIEMGRKKMPDDKTLFNQELNLYTQMGKIETLLKKLGEVIKNEPNNILYLFYRGAILNEEAVKVMESGYKYSDTASEARSTLKRTSNPAKKKELSNTITNNLAKRDSIFGEANTLFGKAEKDYNEALLLDPYYYDALFNIGVLYFNKNKELVNKYNYLDVYDKTDKETAKKLEAEMKDMLNKALEYLVKAEEVKPDDKDLLYALQQTYAQLGNDEKSKEYREKRQAMGE